MNRNYFRWIFPLVVLHLWMLVTLGAGLTDQEVRATFLTELNRTKIRENLEFITRNPHVSGTYHNNRLADHLADFWTSLGFDSVEKNVYNVLLSYPDRQNPNIVELLNEDGDVLFTSKHMETVLRPEDAHPDMIPMFNAFSPNGTVQGDLVFANYARPQDFEMLARLGVNVSGNIVIARYGLNYRGNKVKLAHENGAVGIILFNDPEWYAQEGEEADKVYPNKNWLPGTGAQRGSIDSFGDNQTPDYPALQNVYRLPIEDVGFPAIPCQPIGYNDAKHLLSRLGGLEGPRRWETSFNIGPGFKNEIAAKKVRLSVHNQLKPTNITNVIGIIKGAVEPDRYVIAGNHRDAWGFGAVDASSGTAQMMEVTRVFSKLVSLGWRPRRSIVFCSWDAEEYGLTGSYEWVEDNLLKLTHRAVAYVNTDSCVSDDLFIPNASPDLAQLLINITKLIPSPVNESESLYTTWYEDAAQLGLVDSDGQIKVLLLRGGTDHVPFFALAGVSSLNFAFQHDPRKYPKSFSGYQMYHTAYDTFYLVDNFIDPEYRRMAACGHLNLFALHRLADDRLVPISLSGYANGIRKAFQHLQQDGVWWSLQNNSFNVDHFNDSVQDFLAATEEWTRRINNLTTDDLSPLEVRAINDQLMLLDKAFLKSGGIPFQPRFRHLVFALSLRNAYGSSSFPGLRDLVYQMIHQPSDDDSQRVQLERHISDLVVAFHTATNILQPNFII